MAQATISKLSDKELFAKIGSLARSENEATVNLLVHLIELEKRQSYLELGYSSLFDYMRRKLRYSEPGALRRITAARCVRVYPEVYDLLLQREVSLSTIAVFAPILNAENKAEVLKGVCGLSKNEAERYVASYRPRETVRRESIKPVAVIRKADKRCEAKGLSLFSNPPRPAPAPAAEPATAQQDEKPAQSEPENKPEERFELRFSVSAEMLEQLNRARTVMAQRNGKMPSIEEAFEACVGEYLNAHDPKKREERRSERKVRQAQKAKVAESQEKLPPPGEVKSLMRSRHIPDAVYDAVMNRDRLCCAYVGPDGTKCTNKVGLQVDHRMPFGKGGGHGAENLRVLCARHNRLEAKRVFGAGVMRRYCKVQVLNNP